MRFNYFARARDGRTARSVRRRFTMLPWVIPGVSVFAGAGPAGTLTPDRTPASSRTSSAFAYIVPSDNRRPAGKLENGVLTVRLDARTGMWRPEGKDGARLSVAAFAEEGKPLQNPGPLIRVPAGTEVRAIVRNSLEKPLTLFGLGAERGLAADSFVVDTGAVRELRFRATTPGTYYYAGRTSRSHVFGRTGDDSQLNGAIIVDPPGTTGEPNDRIFMISWWVTVDPKSPTGLDRATLVINGRSWPHTERLDVAQGDSLRWRWINLTELDHPMHLHGFYYRIDSHGDILRDTTLAGDARPFVNTELMLPGATMDIAWEAQREGNWVFHCHFAFHVSHWLTMTLPDSSASAHKHHRMSGLVLGISVKPGPRPATATTASRARQLRLLMQEAPKRYDDSTHGFGFILHEPGRGTARDSVASDSVPQAGPTIVLTRGEPVAITVINRLRQQTGVHWHGIELESFPDGIPGWSGTPGRIMPPIAPGDSFVAEFVPPRSGTFLYHSHSNEDAQISSGLYGALIVLEPGETLDPKRDLVFLLGANGPFPNQGMLNGESEPSEELELQAGTTYRLRLIHIQPDWRVHFSMIGERGLAEWRPVAKDGADLPMSRRVNVPARLLAGPGETADFEFTPTAGRYRMEITTWGTGWHLPLAVVAR
jgi:FtsP/CotA-like multicopper oxidase with cupredoxin domain